MNLSENTQAVLLLTSHFTQSVHDAIKPLTPTEWGRFAAWLKEQDLSPTQLLNDDIADTLSNWQDNKIPLTRLEALLGRGHALALAMEKWQRAGIWVLTRADADYPKRLKLHLKNDAPPFLFGAGNPQLLNNGGVAVVGSRTVNEENLQYADALAVKAALTGVNIVSGCAKGIDEAAMSGALSVDGSVIGIVADSLLKAATSQKWRDGLLNNNLVLVSPFYPEAGFSVGNAMARNKYIYCLADAAVVVHSGKTGGTWSGAIENLKKAWIPVWIKPTADAEAGNADIVKQGAQWCEGVIEQFDISRLFTYCQNIESVSNNLYPVDNTSKDVDLMKESLIIKKASDNLESVGGFYQIFLQELKRVCSVNAKSIDEISDCMQLHKLQVRDWLEQAQNEGTIKKLNKPVRYQWYENSSDMEQLNLF